MVLSGEIVLELPRARQQATRPCSSLWSDLDLPSSAPSAPWTHVDTFQQAGLRPLRCDFWCS